jgi:urea carboxylase
MALKAVAAEVSGLVSAVVVEVGAAVRRGDALVLLECMKMEIPVEAPCDGVVSRIAAEPGAAVQEGQTLVVIEG